MCFDIELSSSDNLGEIISQVDKLDQDVKSMSEKSQVLIARFNSPMNGIIGGLNKFVEFKKKLVNEHPDLDTQLRKRILEQEYYQSVHESLSKDSSQHDSQQEVHLVEIPAEPEQEKEPWTQPEQPRKAPENLDMFEKLLESNMDNSSFFVPADHEPQSGDEYELKLCKNIREFFQIHSPNMSFRK